MGIPVFLPSNGELKPDLFNLTFWATYIFFGIIILLETLTHERASREGRPRAGALPLAPLIAVFFRYDNLAHLYPKNPMDGLLRKFGGGIYPMEYSRGTFDPYINRPLTSAFNTNSFIHSFLPQLELA
jgi:hypothetical protein